MNINPGNFKKRICIIKQEKTKDADGFDVPEDVIVRRCKAQFSRLSGKEVIEANSEIATDRVRFLVRYTRVELSTKMIVLYENHRYNIKYINEYGDSKEYVELICSVGRND